MSFIAAAQGIEFYCDFRDELNWKIVGHVYSWGTLDVVDGAHMTGKTDVNVKHVESMLTATPQNWTNFRKASINSFLSWN